MGKAEIVEHARTISNGMMHHLDMELLWDWASGCESVAEVGVWKGATTIILADACKGPVYAVDWFEGNPGDPVTEGYTRWDVGRDFLYNTRNYPNIHLFLCQSAEAPSHLLPNIDFVFIDADHRYEYVKADITAWLPKTNLILAGHDAQFPSVKQAVLDTLGEDAILGPGSLWMKRLVCRDNR